MPRQLSTLPQPVRSLSRRSFLGSTATACGLLYSVQQATLAWGQTASKAVPLKLGLVTYNWGKDWDIPTIIKNCAAAGFEGVELRSTHRHGVEITLDKSQRKESRQAFEGSGVELMGLGSACEFHSSDPAIVKKNIEETKEFIRLCHDVGGTGVKVRPNGLPDEVPVEKTLVQIGKALNEVASYGAEHGVQIRLEVHGSGTSELPHVKTIMDVADHPNNVVCWNCNPQDLAGDGFEANYALVESRMGTVHIHDLRVDNYPWETLVARLQVCNSPGFTGWTLLEDGAVPDDIVEAMRENRIIWERLAKG